MKRKGADIIRWKAVPNREGLELPAVPTRQAAIGCQPDGTIHAPHGGPANVPRQPVLRGVGPGRSRVIPGQAGLGGEPQNPIRIAADHRDMVLRQAVIGREIDKGASIEARDTPDGCDPDGALRLELDRVVRQRNVLLKQALKLWQALLGCLKCLGWWLILLRKCL